MSQARALYHVQELELEIIDHRKRIKEIDIQLEDNKVVTNAEAEQQSAQETFDAIRLRVKDMEQQIEAVANKRKATETRLYSGNVKNPKELQDMQKEIESLTKRHAELDENLLLLIMERDEAKDMLELTNQELEKVKATWEAEHSDLLSEKSELEKKSETLMADRKDSLKAVHDDAMKQYNSLRTSKSNRPVAVMENRTCSVCGIEQNGAIASAVNKDDSLVYCQNCGRILVRL